MAFGFVAFGAVFGGVEAETNIGGGGVLFFGEVDDEVLGDGGVQVFVDDVCVVLDGVVGGEHFADVGAWTGLVRGEGGAEEHVDGG